MIRKMSRKTIEVDSDMIDKTREISQAHTSAQGESKENQEGTEHN